ncbi:MAG TPA: PqqD family protein [Solirubrobacteraceae bacterium]|nr:PqqD family protein [Solirubrobacteraceae bacterium]
MTFRLRTDELSWRVIDDEVVILDADRATYLAVNGVGARLWPALVEGATLDQLAGMLVEAYEIDHAQARSDAHRFVAALSDQGLIAA